MVGQILILEKKNFDLFDNALNILDIAVQQYILDTVHCSCGYNSVVLFLGTSNTE